MILDGFDVQIIGFAAPALVAGGAAGFFVGIAIVLLLAVAGLLALRRHVRS